MFSFRMVIAACISACTSTAVASRLAWAAAQAWNAHPHFWASSRFIKVTNLSDSGPRSFSGAIREFPYYFAGKAPFISFGAVTLTITLESHFPRSRRKSDPSTAPLVAYALIVGPSPWWNSRNSSPSPRPAGLPAGSCRAATLGRGVATAQRRRHTLNAVRSSHDTTSALNLTGASPSGNRGKRRVRLAGLVREPDRSERSGSSCVVGNVICP